MAKILLNSVLLNESDILEAIRFLNKIGLPSHFDRVKSWDLAQFIELVMKKTKTDNPILDCGCMWSPIMAYLYYLGYKNLFGIDLLINRFELIKQRFLQSFCVHVSPVVVKEFIRYPTSIGLKKIIKSIPKGLIDNFHQKKKVKIFKANITDMPFNDNSIKAISCLSVIEHGVNIDNFILEAKRVLEKEGLLYISTDFWCDEIKIQNFFPFGKEIGQTKIFTPNEIITNLISPLLKNGFELLSNISIKCDEKMVHWMGEGYTFFSVAAIKK